MELSILNVFNGKVYSCDDKSGIVFELPLKAGEDGDIVPIPVRTNTSIALLFSCGLSK